MKNLLQSHFIAVFLLLSLLPTLAWAQLQVRFINNQDLTGQSAPLQFKVEAPNAAQISYSIRLADRPDLTPISTGEVSVNNGVAWISFQPDFPCFVICQVNASGQFAQAAGVYQAYKIQVSEPGPTDFDAFWNNQKNILAQIPPDFQLLQIEQQAYYRTYSINFALPNNRRCYGYLCIPEGQGPFPAIIELPAFGSQPNIVQAPTSMAERGGAIALSLNIHNNVPTEAGPGDYILNGAMDPATNYLKYALLGVVRAIDYLQTRPDYNGQVGMLGVSQGGGLSLIAAGIDERISLVVSLFAALSDHSGLKYNKPSGFPYYYNTGGSNLLPAVKYYDAAYAAQNFKGVSYTVIGYEDEICPPATTMAAFNALSGEKTLLHLLRNKHNPAPEEFANPHHPNGVYAFLRTHFEKMRTAPWPWGDKPLGYSVSGGADQQMKLNETAQISAIITKNNQHQSNWQGHWSKVSGPGTVFFSDENNAQSSATFSMAGQYILRFVAIDPAYQLENSDRYYSISDDIGVGVMPDTMIDNIPPSITLSSEQSFTSDVFWVDVQSSEPTIGLEPSDIKVSRCQILAIEPNGIHWRLQVKPVIKGKMTIQISSNAVSDLSGNPNSATNVLEIRYYPVLKPYKG